MNVTIRFSGDSGDGMQLVGTLFAESVAHAGQSISTYPDYPAEVRAPQGTIAGVSGFQVHFGDTVIRHPGGSCDTLIAMNPAALIAHRQYLSDGGTVIIDGDSCTEDALKKVNLEGVDIISHLGLNPDKVMEISITQMTLNAVEPFGLDRKAATKCRNIFTLGVTLGMYGIDASYAKKVIEKRLRSKGEEVVKANIAALEAGVNYAENSHLIGEHRIASRCKLPQGEYRSINGNTAVAWGFIAAAERSGRPLFCGSYPITPATGILEELAKHKALGVKTVQAEDEIAGICTAIGASFGGALAVTTTSGPGLALKSEAIGLAVMAQIPLVIVDVQRGGPSTGLPTKSEQADLMQALYGRNGDSPLVVIAAKSPADCFDKAYLAAKIALERMIPVILLTDGNLANGTEAWRIADTKKLAPINPPIVTRQQLENTKRWEKCFNERGLFNPYTIDEKFVRPWAIPGTEGLEHRIGGLEKRITTGEISYKPEDHCAMNNIRHERVIRTEDYIPAIKAEGAKDGLLVVSWGSTYGQVAEAVEELYKEGKRIAHCHFEMLNPIPRSFDSVLERYSRVVVCEQNYGQLTLQLNAIFEDCNACGFMSDDAQQFNVKELKEEFKEYLHEIDMIEQSIKNFSNNLYGKDELLS